jgi:PTH1 family peptidyl-tRNA hydrolase
MFYIVGLGNPGSEYETTRHNTGRIVLSAFLKKNDFPAPAFVPKINALVSESKLGKEKVTAVMPETFMNKSGAAVGKLVKSVKAAERLIVIHDDLDIPLGKFKISFNKNSGGHKGVESVIRAVKTKTFIRIRVGISPTTPSGKLKKPTDEKATIDFILAKFKPAELKTLKKVAKNAAEAIAMIVTEGREKAMAEYNRFITAS